MGAASWRIAEERFSVEQYLPKLYKAYGIDVDRSATTVGASA
jgi:hypothetical protein